MTIPNTPAGHAFRAWLSAYNAADSAQLEAYAGRYEPGLGVHAQLVSRRQTGPWDVVAVERSGVHHLEVTLRTDPDSARSYSLSLSMYGVIDMVDSATSHVSTGLIMVGTGTAATAPPISAAQRTVAIDSLNAKLVRNYVLPAVAKQLADSLAARRARGVYDEYVNEIGFASRLNHDLLELGHDRQLGVEYVWRVPMPPPVPTPAARLHCGFDPAMMLDDSVGYVRFNGFSDPELDCGYKVSKAMASVADSRALIIDLRDNAGGSRSMIAYLASYLVEGCTQLDNTLTTKTGEVEKLWTREGLPTPAFGGRKPLYILTSSRTFSAAEELAFDLQSLGRATIVGEQTAGNAATTALGRIGEHLLLRVPVARIINPISATSWQDVGVRPDVSVPSSEALSTAQRLIREHRTSPASAFALEFVSRRRAARTTGPSQPLRGIRFTIDTTGAPHIPRGPLTRFVGMAEFANGRGRIDVTGIVPSPVIALNGITIADPLAKRGDYYVFDNTGFILVRPASRTFSSFVFTRAEFNHTGELLPGMFMMKYTPIEIDTLPTGNSRVPTQHAPLSIHWHMQTPNGGQLYARGWLEVEDAPAVEAGVARWFEVAAALGTNPGGVREILSRGLEVTSVALLRLPSDSVYRARYVEMVFPGHLTDADIDPALLVLPSGYRETPWPGFDHAPSRRASSARVSRWKSLDDPSTQRKQATCREPWLPKD